MSEEKTTMIEKHDKFLFGNGNAERGADERLRLVEEWIETQKDEEKKRREFAQKIVLIIIPTLVVGLFAFLGQAIYFWTNTVPKIEEILRLYQSGGQ